ncbi:hypothetical protein PGTUg99_026557 [Puccinia graminis f. sp. tritici]|uniref:Uncharacterized protein n=1 Tax=Puccinia graminis f. sp. tritici TaxID=56615 RepID=A0A5B0RVU1_PUCGR|nr:hypothetical protein PGTUg99_026557 [Puccinia graminis f. sp. tritici]
MEPINICAKIEEYNDDQLQAFIEEQGVEKYKQPCKRLQVDTIVNLESVEEFLRSQFRPKVNPSPPGATGAGNSTSQAGGKKPPKMKRGEPPGSGGGGSPPEEKEGGKLKSKLGGSGMGGKSGAGGFQLVGIDIVTYLQDMGMFRDHWWIWRIHELVRLNSRHF